MALVIRKTGAGAVREIPLAEIVKAVVQVEFSPPAPAELELAQSSEMGLARPGRRAGHGIDMAALHAVNRGISVNELLETIKSALLTAYRHTRVTVRASKDDRKTGVVPESPVRPIRS